ncbi:hypothetical protein BC938DRAFT_483673 [Jimgerdemannia flammicorona]|uniref:FAD/NAD(P)-binding domain-containing protein n=1 Tax=Jimgerdemannia flammicorona TaxID=994334 RepID=A0A433QBJ5_9FUNG|nr:hypothetical protein BC938DRAFT_483673 [Jimgerdemannia flammicorona]
MDTQATYMGSSWSLRNCFKASDSASSRIMLWENPVQMGWVDGWVGRAGWGRMDGWLTGDRLLMRGCLVTLFGWRVACVVRVSHKLYPVQSSPVPRKNFRSDQEAWDNSTMNSLRLLSVRSARVSRLVTLPPTPSSRHFSRSYSVNHTGASSKSSDYNFLAQHEKKLLRFKILIFFLATINFLLLYTIPSFFPFHEHVIVIPTQLFYLTSPPPKNSSHRRSDLQDQNDKTVPVTKGQDKDPFILVGAGTASFTAAQSIKEKNPEANVIIIGNENDVPYLSGKGLIKGTTQMNLTRQIGELPIVLSCSPGLRLIASVFHELDAPYEIVDSKSLHIVPTSKVKLLLSREVTNLNIDEKTITLDDGTNLKYSKVLLATGAEPKRLQNIPAAARNYVTTYRTVKDFRKLYELTKSATHVGIIGGGFLGSELAVAIADRGREHGVKVTQIVAEEGNMALVFPRSLSQWTTTQIEKDGVKVLRNSTVTSIQSAEDNGVKLILDNGEAIQVDHVIVAIGVEPRVDLARQAGLEIDGRLGGVVVNTELEGCSIFFGFHYNVFPLLNVPRSDVFVAGDISSFYDNILGRRRVEHHDHAMLSGRLAGENMVGAKKPYSHQPMFWSDLGYEAVGLIDSQLNTVSVFSKTKQGSLITTSSENSSDTHKSSAAESAVTSIDHENFGKGVVFYLNDSKKIVGVLMFNVFGKVQVAREILSGSYSQQDINTLIERFDIHGGAQQ